MRKSGPLQGFPIYLALTLLLNSLDVSGFDGPRFFLRTPNVRFLGLPIVTLPLIIIRSYIYIFLDSLLIDWSIIDCGKFMCRYPLVWCISAFDFSYHIFLPFNIPLRWLSFRWASLILVVSSLIYLQTTILLSHSSCPPSMILAITLLLF